MDTETITIIDEDGTEVLYEIVLTFKSDETNKSYVVYKLPGEDNDEVFASVYEEGNSDGGNLFPIESDKEWDIIEEVLNTFLDEEEE